jgi:hypothetical protein
LRIFGIVFPQAASPAPYLHPKKPIQRGTMH